MKRLDWDKTNAEKRIERHGHARMPMLEMPLSWNEVVAGLVPPYLRASMMTFAWSVIVADLQKSDLPSVPENLRNPLWHHIKRSGGILPFAKWLLDPEVVRRVEEQKKRREMTALEKTLLHEVAKCELGQQESSDVMTLIPDHLKNDLGDWVSCLKWAKGHSNYANILLYKKSVLRKRGREK